MTLITIGMGWGRREGPSQSLRASLDVTYKANDFLPFCKSVQFHLNQYKHTNTNTQTQMHKYKRCEWMLTRPTSKCCSCFSICAVKRSVGHVCLSSPPSGRRLIQKHSFHHFYWVPPTNRLTFQNRWCAQALQKWRQEAVLPSAFVLLSCQQLKTNRFEPSGRQ